MCWIIWLQLGSPRLEHEEKIDAVTLFDIFKFAFSFGAGIAAVIGLVLAYRRQSVTENEDKRATTRLHTERFTKAVDQLGGDSVMVQLGGAYALASLADDAPTTTLRQECIDVLCAYLRKPYKSEADLPLDDMDAKHVYLELREVRLTIIRLIRDHLRPTSKYSNSWQGCNFDFTGVVFDGGIVDFSGAEFSEGEIDFSGADFSGSTVSFIGTKFSGGKVNFFGTKFSGGTVDFSEAEFSGGIVDFFGTKFSGGIANFSEAIGEAPLYVIRSPMPEGLIVPDDWITKGYS